MNTRIMMVVGSLLVPALCRANQSAWVITTDPTPLQVSVIKHEKKQIELTRFRIISYEYEPYSRDVTIIARVTDKERVYEYSVNPIVIPAKVINAKLGKEAWSVTVREYWEAVRELVTPLLVESVKAGRVKSIEPD